MTLSNTQKQNVLKKHGLHDTDTGSPEAQIALLSKKIEELSGHLTIHRKDTHSRRGLLAMVEARRKHLRYLKRKDTDRFEKAQKLFKK